MDYNTIDELVSKHLIGSHDQSEHSRKQHGTSKDKNALTTRQRRARLAGAEPSALRGTSYTGLNTKGMKQFGDKMNWAGRASDKPKSDTAGGAVQGALTGAAIGGLSAAALGGKGRDIGRGAARQAAGTAAVGAAAGAASDAYRRKRKARGEDVVKAYDLYEEVEKFRMPKMKKPRINLSSAPKTPEMGLNRAASKPMRRATDGIQAGAKRARNAASGMSRGAKIGAGAGAGVAAAGAGAYGMNRRDKRDQFGKADDVYEIAKAFRADRLAGNIGHEYDLTTDPELYSEIADRFVSKVGGDNFDTSDVDSVYADMGGDWVPVEDVLVELAKALYVGDDETAELIAYAIS